MRQLFRLTTFRKGKRVVYGTLYGGKSRTWTMPGHVKQAYRWVEEEALRKPYKPSTYHDRLVVEWEHLLIEVTTLYTMPWKTIGNEDFLTGTIEMMTPAQFEERFPDKGKKK